MEKLFYVVFCILLLGIYMLIVLVQLFRVEKRELIWLLLFTINYVLSVRSGFLFLWVLRMDCVFFTVALPVSSIYLFTILEDFENASTRLYPQNVLAISSLR